jgi:hypothetical protein
MFVPDLVEQNNFLEQVAEMEAKHKLEMEQLLLKNGRQHTSGWFNVKHDESKTFETLEDFKRFVRDIYDTMVEEHHAGYRDTRVVIPEMLDVYMHMSADFYADYDSEHNGFAKDLIVVRIRVSNARGHVKKYEMYRYRENDAPSVEAAFIEVFDAINNDWKQV